MALEDTLTRIAIALERLAGMESEKRGPGRPPKAKAEPAPAPKEEAEPAPAPEPVVEVPAPSPAPAPAKPSKAAPIDIKAYTADDVRSALVAYQKRSTPEAARTLLKEVGGADTLRTLKPEKYGDVIKATEST